jgi:hypothetical protein
MSCLPVRVLFVSFAPVLRSPGLLIPVLSLTAALNVAAQTTPAGPQCSAAGPLVRLPAVPEASGVAASVRTPGRFWVHNDSGEPILYALDAQGRTTGRFTVSGTSIEDWEAVGVGPCPAGSCVYAADIGDNNGKRPQIAVYRFAEPEGSAGTIEAEPLFATFPDAPNDAETLLVTPDGRLYIVTKGDTGPVALYRFPDKPEAGRVSRLERVGPSRDQGRVEANRVTDGSISADGQWVVLRSNEALSFYRAADLLAGRWRPAGRVSLEKLGEPQGEGVTFASGNRLVLAGEGGGKSAPGTFGTLTCSFGR